MKNPSLPVLIALSIGIMGGYFFPVSFSSLFFIPAGILFIFLVFFIKKESILIDIIFLFTISLTGFIYYEARTTVFPKNHISRFVGLNEEVEIKGCILKDPDLRPDKVILTVKTDSIFIGNTGFPVTGRLRVTVKKRIEEFEYGDRIAFYGYLYYPDFTRNPHSFDYRSWLKRQDIYGAMSIYDIQDIKIIGRGRCNPFISRVVFPIKHYIWRTIDSNIGGAQGAFLKGITIGMRGEIPKNIQEYFENTGVIHLLAVSGLHVGIIAGILFLLFSLLRFPGRLNLIVSSIVLIIYAFVVDLRPSVIRATIMTILIMIALEGERDTDTFNSITVAALFLLIINPSNLFELGFQLSFAAAGCIIYGFRRIYPILFGFAGREGFISTLVTQPFTVSLCAQAGVSALIAHYFFRLPIIALIANVFVIPFAALSVGIGFALIIINLLHISLLTQIFAGACFFSTTLTLKLVQLFAAVPHGHYWIGSVSPLFVIFYFLLFVTLINAKKSLIARKSFIYILLIACNVLIWSRVYHIYHPENRITVLDVGMGNSLFCEFANGKKVLIDGGKWTKTFDTGEGVVAPFLRAKGIRRIDAVIATSPYYYNTGGLVYIMENFDVKGAATNNAPYPTWSYYKFLKTIYENGISYRSLSSGDFFGPFEVLNPTQEILREVNDEPRKYTKDASLSLFLNIGNNSILLPGDASHLAVKKSNIMKAPYFGGYRDSLVSRVSPDIVIIQVGRNRWNLPDEDMLGIYREKIHKIFRTDKDGAIIVKFNDKRFHLSTMKELSRDESWKEKLLRWTGNI